jgi:predicted RNA binding protein YcfA (HicA-like mRNA interferase family)
MPKLPRITGREAVDAFCRAGYTVDRVKGSHSILKRPGSNRLTIPVHAGKTVGAGLLLSQIAAAGLTTDEFLALLRG